VIDFTISLAGYSLRLDPVTGDLKGIRWHDPGLDLIRDRRLAENFRILLPRPGMEASYFCSRDQVVARIERDDHGITCVYDTLRNEHETVDVTVRYRIEGRGRSLEVSMSVENRTDRVLAEALFGMLGGVQGVGLRASSDSLLPGAHANLGGNIFRTFPAGEYGGGNLGITYSACGFLYPGYGGLSMSWADFFNRRLGLGVYYGLHDPETRLCALYLELRPFTTSTVTGTNWPSPRDVPSDEPRGLTVGWLNFPHSANATEQFGPAVIEVHPGDWRSGSAIYRTWFDRHFPIAGTSWLRDEPAWQSTILANPEDVVVHRFEDLGRMAADAAAYGVTTFEVCGWDVGGIDRGYPNYRPDPRLGTREEFRSGLGAIRDSGVHPVVFANLQFADTATPEYRDELHRYAVHGRWAEDPATLGFGEGTIGARLGLTRSNMALVSLAHPELRSRLVDQMTELVADGAQAIQLDKTIVTQYLDFNPRLTTSPDRSLPAGLLDTLREILERGRQVDPEFALASETWWDRTFQFVDVLYTRMVDIDIPSESLLHTFPEIASTSFAENPADFNVMNNGLRYGFVWAMAPRHYQESLDERLTQPLSRYVAELIRIRFRHRDILFHGRLEDDPAVMVERHPDLRYSVFGATSSRGARRAVVLVNFGDRPVTTVLDRDAPSGQFEICQPFEADRLAGLPAAIRLAPRGCAVVVEIEPLTPAP
jgi:hypothetical protein